MSLILESMAFHVTKNRECTY